VFGHGSDRHIARWRTVKSVTVFEVKENGFRQIHQRERFTNELALIYENGRTLLPVPKKNGPAVWPQYTMRDALALDEKHEECSGSVSG
jgi:hypothetical protein